MMRLLLDHPNLDINDPSGLLHCAMRRTDPVATDLAASGKVILEYPLGVKHGNLTRG